ncbi:MAG: acetyltransferase [Hyphomicrobiaceae bacterium]
MPLPLVILGAGGHGRVVAEVAAATGRDLLGFIDGRFPPGERVNGLPVLARDLDGLATKAPPDRAELFVAVGDNATRFRLAAEAIARGYRLASLVHPSAILSPTVTLGAGSVLMAGVVVNANAVIGDFCIVNTAASLDHDNWLADGVQICPGVRSAGTVRYGRSAFVGTGAVIVPGISIGAEAVVGAGAVVIRDVFERARVAGNPARPITPRPSRDG